MKLIGKAIFLGSKEFGLEIFKSIYNSDDEIEWLIVCPDDRQDSRTHYHEFKKFADEHRLNLKLAKKVSNVDEIIDNFCPDIMFVIGYYQILPKNLLDKIKEGTWGIHNSLLPKYRGSSPLVWQLINGEKKIGSSLFKFSEGMDDGDILHQVSFDNSSKYTIKTATKKLENLWIECLPSIWKSFKNEEIIPSKQNHSDATYCSKRNPDDGKINWSKSAAYLDRFIRAQAKPYPMAFFHYDKKIIHIEEHELDNRIVSGTCGQVIEKNESGVIICCGNNSALKIIKVEISGVTYHAAEVLNSINIRL